MLKINQGASELADYYSQSAESESIDQILHKIASYCDANEDKPACTLKAFIHNIIADECGIKVFRHYPFFWETCVGRSRYNWGISSPLSGYLHMKSLPIMFKPYEKKLQKYQSLCFGWGNPVGYDHHCPDYEKIINHGLLGIIEETKKRMSNAQTQEEHDFLKAVISSNQAVIRLAERFATEADRLAQGETNQIARANLLRIATAARRVPAHPAETLYEALACILFIRENIGSLESFGVSTFGHLDRILYPFCRSLSDTRELIDALLSFTDAKFGLCDSFYSETSTTIVIGGCDENGIPVFNEITKMIVEACIENKYIGTKIVARISSKHTNEYYSLLGKFIASGANVLVMPNDDTLIPANRRWNKKLKDCRLYIGGGCHEMLLAGTEVNTRSDTWINLPGILMRTLFPNPKTPDFESVDNAPDYDSFYRTCIRNVRHMHNVIACAKEEYERLWRDYDAAPFLSSSLADCIENAKDLTAGGARYNSVSLSMSGAATFLDSLYAVKMLVYDEKKMTLTELRQILSSDFVENESLRLYIQNRLPRHGQGNQEFDRFAAHVMHDLSCMAGQPNGRGGIVTPAFYPHDTFIEFGNNTMATPDGRKAGSWLSRGFSPSESTPVQSVTDIINSLKSFDLTLFPESFATEITLPAIIGNTHSISALASLIQVFAESGGSTLQINVLNREELIRAKAEPEKYPNLMVRVCGYSQTFNSLSDEKKDEIISRAIRA